MEYFIADTHFGHKNILDFESETRGIFETVEDMNSFLISQWNSRVHKNDTVYMLGDFSLHGRYNNVVKIISQLRGNIIVIKGNHDSDKLFKRLLADGYVSEYHEVGIRIKKDKQIAYLTHYPLEIGIRKNVWSVHGHIHSRPSNLENQLNVGIDSPFMKQHVEFGQPISIDELFDYMIQNPIIKGERF